MSEPPADPYAMRRKRLRFRAVHRGFKEADLVFGGFADVYLARLGAEGLDEFEALLEQPESMVYLWLTGQEPVPPEFDTAVFGLMKEFCGRTRPTWKS